ncbi:Cationic peroxidase 2 [Bienertia sinuspersici]
MGVPRKTDLRVYEVIDEAKAELEAHCPQNHLLCKHHCICNARYNVYQLRDFDCLVLVGQRDGQLSPHSIRVSHCTNCTPKIYLSNYTNLKYILTYPNNIAILLRPKCLNSKPSKISSNFVDHTDFEDCITPYHLDNLYY